MAETKQKPTTRELLTRGIDWVRTWDPDLYPGSLEMLFMQLEWYADQNEEPELWEEFRRALRETPAMQDPDLREFLERKDVAEEGYWWWDPDQW